MKKPSDFFAKRIFYRVTALAICATLFWGVCRIEAWRPQKDTSRITTSKTPFVYEGQFGECAVNR